MVNKVNPPKASTAIKESTESAPPYQSKSLHQSLDQLDSTLNQSTLESMKAIQSDQLSDFIRFQTETDAHLDRLDQSVEGLHIDMKSMFHSMNNRIDQMFSKHLPQSPIHQSDASETSSIAQDNTTKQKYVTEAQVKDLICHSISPAPLDQAEKASWFKAADIGYFKLNPSGAAVKEEDYKTIQGNTYWHNVHLFVNQAESITESKNINLAKHLHECLQGPAQQWYMGELDQADCQLLSSNMTAWKAMLVDRFWMPVSKALHLLKSNQYTVQDVLEHKSI